MSLKAPCLNCPDRKIIDGKTCHSTCKKYLEFKNENEKIREEKNKIRQSAQDLYGFKEAKFKRINRKLHKQ